MKEFIPLKPMKARRADIEFLRHVSEDNNWAAGEKFDGFRELWYLGSVHNELLSSLGNSHIAKVPQFQTAVPELSGTVLDTEGMSPTRRREDNASCFKAHPDSAIPWQQTNGSAFLVAFDVLAYKGRDVTREQFGSRRVVLEQVVSVLRCHGYTAQVLQLEKLVFNSKLRHYNTITARTQTEGHEGIILKDMYAPYTPGKRTNAWMKVKRTEVVVATILGFTSGCGKYKGQIGSVIFQAAGVEGTASGMDDHERLQMTQHPELYIGKQAYFRGLEITDLGALNNPQYKGLAEKEEQL